MVFLLSTDKQISISRVHEHTLMNLLIKIKINHLSHSGFEFDLHFYNQRYCFSFLLKILNTNLDRIADHAQEFA